MAWGRIVDIIKLIAVVNGNSYVYENFDSPELPAMMLTSINQNSPYSNAFSPNFKLEGESRGYSERDIEAYNQISALADPEHGIDLIALCNQAGANNDITIYREDFGQPFRITFRKRGGGSGYIAGVTIRYYMNGSEINMFGWGGGDNIVNAYLGFMDDGTNYIPYFRFLMDPYESSSTGINVKCIVALAPGVSGSARTTLSSFTKILIVGNIIPPAPPPGPDEPYGDDSYDTYTGGDGDHDDTSDTIPEPALPIMYGSNSGMCTAWVPTIGEIRLVAKALVDPNVAQAIWQSVAKLSDVVIGLSLFPCTIGTEATPQKVKVNFMGVHINTGVDCHLAADQFEEIDCGNITINEYWGNCLDYNPYTRISIYLPFCGMYELDTDEVMGRTINVSYRIDILSGACLATIKIDGSVFYQYSGQCSAQIPLSSVTFDQFIASMIDVGIATATGSKMLGAAGAALSEARQDFNAGKSSGVGGDALMDAKENYQAVRERTTNSIADAAVGAVMGQKGFYQHAGALAGSPGFLAIRKPYLIIKRPEQLIPGMYGKFHGFPSNTTAVLGDLVGYTEVGDIRLNIPEATVDEIIECEQLLKGGVVI